MLRGIAGVVGFLVICGCFAKELGAGSLGAELSEGRLGRLDDGSDGVCGNEGRALSLDVVLVRGGTLRGFVPTLGFSVVLGSEPLPVEAGPELFATADALGAAGVGRPVVEFGLSDGTAGSAVRRSANSLAARNSISIS